MLQPISYGSFRDLKELLSDCDDFDEVPAEVRDRAWRLCAKFLGGAWKGVEASDIVIKRIKGGMSNMLFMCELPAFKKAQADEPQRVLLRVYFNPETENHLVAESVIFTLLSERHLGPRLYGIFNGGRLEEFIPSRPLKCDEIRQYELSTRIASKLANVHQLDVPIAKDPDYVCEAIERRLNKLTHCVQRRLGNSREYRTPIIGGRLMSLDSLWAEYEHVRNCLQYSRSPTVFCHNDLQEGNILLPTASMGNIRSGSVTEDLAYLRLDSRKKLVIIDFEYASYNYRAFDFANHFIEWTLDYNYPKPPYFEYLPQHFPTVEQQRDFFRTYLQTSSKTEPTEKEVDAMITETRSFVPVSHFFWGVWALLQVELSPVEFGFEEYGKARLSMYYASRDALDLLNPNDSPRPFFM